MNTHPPLVNRRALMIGGLFAVLSSSRMAWADGAHAAFTVIEHNPQTQAWEVIHRLMALDLEISLIARTARVVKLEDMAENEALIEAYLGDYFSLATPDGQSLPLSWVGATTRMDMALAYQETPAPKNIAGLVINNQILTDAHPTQVNTVNITYNGRTQTRIFTQNDGPQLVELSSG